MTLPERRKLAANGPAGWTPIRDDRVRIGPVLFPAIEWIGVFVRWDHDAEHFYAFHPKERKTYRIRTEALRGPEMPA